MDGNKRLSVKLVNWWQTCQEGSTVFKSFSNVTGKKQRFKKKKKDDFKGFKLFTFITVFSIFRTSHTRIRTPLDAKCSRKTVENNNST